MSAQTARLNRAPTNSWASHSKTRFFLVLQGNFLSTATLRTKTTKCKIEVLTRILAALVNYFITSPSVEVLSNAISHQGR